MEKIKISNKDIYNISSIKEYNNLLTIAFLDTVNISDLDLSTIEVLTINDEVCRVFKGYDTIYKEYANAVILSNDGSIYVEPIEPEPIPIEPVEPYIPTLDEVQRNKL